MGESTLETFLGAAVYILTLVLAGIGIRIATERVKVLKRPTDACFHGLNVFVVWAVLPLVVFISIARYSLREILGFGNALLLAFVGLCVCFVSSVVISYIAGDDRKTTVAVTLNSSFMNVTYLGLPVVYALLGGGGLGPASLYAMGIGIPHLVFGIMLVSSAANKRVTPGYLIENVVTFPAAFALIVALLFVGFGAPLPDVVRDFFDANLAKIFFALMLLVVGYQMVIIKPHKYAGLLTTVGAIRFLICPLVTYAGILALGLKMSDLTPMPALIQAAMPPAIFNMILAYNYKLDRELYGALIFYLTLISLFVVLPLLFFLLSIS
jgi:hypothetical protein